MAKQALFAGLVVDERDRPVDTALVGGEAFYVVDDDGFSRHIDSEHVDRQVLDELLGMIEGHEDFLSMNTMKMIGQEDPFTKAMIERSLSEAPEQVEKLLETGLPEAARMQLGMVGFRVVIDDRGDLVELVQPSAEED
ncbi:MAG TPA: hypothetical protein VGA52_14990 [Anaerolineales bacterium]|jgi:hypothetical protein